VHEPADAHHEGATAHRPGQHTPGLHDAPARPAPMLQAPQPLVIPGLQKNATRNYSFT
jgi:hypothetical protein